MSVFAPSLRPTAAKAGPIGPGAGVLLTEFPLAALLGNTPQKKMRKAWEAGISVPWIRAAERTVGGVVQSIGWHLEDDQEDTVDEAYPNAYGREALALLRQPQANLAVGNRLFQSELWRLTSRHMGLCGNAFWFLDQLNAYGIPAAILYLRPDRLTPVEDEAGNLTGWLLDANQPSVNGGRGVGLRLDQVMQFMLEPPDEGHFGIGLVESALLKTQLTTALDRHLGQVLSAGGRLSGFVAPKQGDMLGEAQYQQLVNDFRTVVEQPDAAKRLQVLRGPVDFTATTMSPQELQIRDLMTGSRDDLLALWGVPLSKLGIHDRGRGLGASEVTDKDTETLWENAVKPRLIPFAQRIQYRLLDPYREFGVALTLELDIPTFDDDSPRYDAVQKALGVPLTTNQRLAILGLDPIPEEVVGPSGGPLGEEIILPATSVLYASAAPHVDNSPAPPPAPVMVAPPEDNRRAAAMAGETAQGAGAVVKATPIHPTVAGLRTSLVALRTALASKLTPRVRTAARDVLAEQRAEVVDRLRRNADHISANRKDTSVWWDARKWDTRLVGALRPQLAAVAESVSLHIGAVLPPEPSRQVKAGPPGAVERVLDRGAARVGGINATTRDKVQAALQRGLDEGLSVLDVADLIEGVASEDVATAIGLDMGALFDDYRAELIARTELMDAYNAAALGSYGDAGISEVQAIDGDEDEACAARDGAIFTMDEAETIEDHPNGTLDWVPVLASDSAAAA